MRKIYFFLSLLFVMPGAWGQITIFSENIGTAPATTAIAAHTFQNSGTLTYADGGATAPADVRNTSASTGYTGASGTGNVFFTSIAGDRGFSIESINASTYTNLQVQFGYRKESASVLPSFALGYWDGAAWQAVPFTFNEAANASVGWYLSPIINLPAGSQINGLKLRWVKSGAASVRLDDVKLTGILSGGTSLSATSLTAFGNVCINTTAGPNSFTITGNNLTTADVTVSALDGFTYAVSAGGPYTTSLVLSQGGGAYSQEIFVRFSPLAVQSYSDDINIAGGGATPIIVSVAGSGVNTMASVAPGIASNITGTTADVSGVILSNGCSPVTAYGIEYGLGNYPPGNGTLVAGGSLSGNNFTSNLTGLAPAATYYYRTYATNAGGTMISGPDSFTTLTQVLPVNFGNVKATQQSASIKVEWSNLTELDVIDYTVERSADGRNFNSIGQLNARLNNGGKADYNFIDANPLSGTNFYRIRSLEGTGRVKYSIIVNVDTRGGATQLVLYLNPSTGTQLGYHAVNLAKGQYVIRIFNAAGQQVYNQALNHPGGSVSESIPLPSSMKAGVYTLQMNSTGMNLSKIFVVQ